jgi:MFS family permease
VDLPCNQGENGVSIPVMAKDGEATRRWYSGSTRGQWLALTAAFLGWGFDGFEMGVFPQVARPALIELLDLSEPNRIAKDESLDAELRQRAKAEVDEPVRQWNGILSAAFLFGASAGGLLFGWVGDRVGRVRAMIFSVLTYALVTGCCAFSRAAWQLAGLRFVAALGMGGEWSLGVALVMESWSSHARPVLAGLIGAASNVGFFCTGLLALVLQPGEHWRLILAVCVFPALLTFLLRIFVPESKRWEHAVATGPRARIGDVFVAGLRSRAFLGAGLGAIALLATWGAVQWVPLWIGQMTGDKVREAAAVATIFSSAGAIIGSFLGAIFGSRLTRRLGYFTLCLTSLAVCQFAFLTRTSYDVGLLLTLFLVGAFSASFYGWLPLYLPELFPTRVRAAGQGFCYNFGRSLAAVGVLLTTFAVDLKGNFAQASALVCLVYVVGLLVAWLIPETKGQPLPD